MQRIRRKRRYVLHRRQGARVLIVALHGFRQSPERPTLLPGRLGLPFPAFTQFDRFPVPAHVVYPVGVRLNWRTQRNSPANPDVQFLQRMLGDLQQELAPLDGTYLFGFSDGGTMAHLLAQYVPCAGLCVASGWVPRNLRPRRDLARVVLFSGDAGPVERAAKQQADRVRQIYAAAHAPHVVQFVRAGQPHDWNPADNAQLAQSWGLLSAKRRRPQRWRL